MENNKFKAGLDKLEKPVLPLVRLVQILYLTGPFDTVNDVVAELNEPIETSCLYNNPQQALAPYLDIMAEFHRIKKPTQEQYAILNESDETIDHLEAIELWVGQQVVSKELETINSLLCSPCECTLCCVGPDQSLDQHFFEIPLSQPETEEFPLQCIDTEKSRYSTSNQEQPLEVNGKPFYESEIALYHWQNGWSLILPRNTTCPQLQSNRCMIYPSRPDVCRRPQIFPYLLEREPSKDQDLNGTMLPAYIGRRKILAIWDCPYVKLFKDKIAAYAEMCELEPVFKENKA